MEAPDGALWIGTDGGLAHYAGGVFRRYGVADGLTNDAIYSLLLDREGVLWVSTLGGGLHRFQNGSFTAFTTQQGLFDSIIFQILDDDSGHLWMSSNRGVYRVAKSDLDAVARRRSRTIPWRLFGTADGMESSECNGGNQPAGVRTRDGRLWFPTLKGAVVVDPERLSTNTVPPPVQLEEVIIDKRRVDPYRKAAVPPAPDRSSSTTRGSPSSPRRRCVSAIASRGSTRSGWTRARGAPRTTRTHRRAPTAST